MNRVSIQISTGDGLELEVTLDSPVTDMRGDHAEVKRLLAQCVRRVERALGPGYTIRNSEEPLA